MSVDGYIHICVYVCVCLCVCLYACICVCVYTRAADAKLKTGGSGVVGETPAIDTAAKAQVCVRVWLCVRVCIYIYTYL